MAEARLADALGIKAWHAVLGGSMGGARALEWAVTFPERVQRCAEWHELLHIRLSEATTAKERVLAVFDSSVGHALTA